MQIKWNEITWYSRLGALIVFLLIIPLLSFFIGMRVEEVKQLQNPAINKVSDSNNIDTDHRSVEGINKENERFKLKNGFSFEIPKGWKISSSSYSTEEYDRFVLNTQENKSIAQLSCPPFPAGGPYGTQPLREDIERTFNKDGATYKVNYIQAVSEFIEIGSSTPAEVIKSFVYPSSTVDYKDGSAVCILFGGDTDSSFTTEELKGFDLIFNTWQ